MFVENPYKQEAQGGSISVCRTVEEIKARITELEKEISRHDVWIDTGISSKTLEPNSSKKQDILNAKLLELHWFLGDDIKISDGL